MVTLSNEKNSFPALSLPAYDMAYEELAVFHSIGKRFLFTHHVFKILVIEFNRLI